MKYNYTSFILTHTTQNYFSGKTQSFEKADSLRKCTFNFF